MGSAVGPGRRIWSARRRGWGGARRRARDCLPNGARPPARAALRWVSRCRSRCSTISGRCCVRAAGIAIANPSEPVEVERGEIERGAAAGDERGQSFGGDRNERQPEMRVVEGGEMGDRGRGGAQLRKNGWSVGRESVMLSEED